MRILHVVPSYLPAVRYGGPIVSVHGLARAQAQLGHNVHVFTTNVDGDGVSPVPLAEPVDLDRVKVWYFPCAAGRRMYRSLAMAEALADQVADFDVLHLHSVFLWPTLAAARAARKAGVPYMIAPRGMLVADLIAKKSRLLKTGWICLFERRNIEHAAAVHVTAELEASEMTNLGLNPRRTVIVPNGIEMPDRLAAGDVASEPYILCLGRLSWKKGIDRLIQSMVHVPSVNLVIAGNDDEGLLPQLEEIARVANVQNRVRFVGPVDGEAKWRFIQQARVFALASHSENFGIAVLEAMACGVPVVVTPEVGLATAIRDANAGLVVDGHPDTFGPAIAALLADQSMLAACGANGRATAEQNFSWTAIARQMHDVYDTITAETKH